MNPIIEGLWKAVELLTSLDPEVFAIMFLSLRVSGTAVFLAALLAIPLGSLVALRDFRGKHLVVNLVYTLMGLPPVVAGLFVYLLLSSSGPLAPLSLLFTPTAMILAQVSMAIPITGLPRRSTLSPIKQILPGTSTEILLLIYRNSIYLVFLFWSCFFLFSVICSEAMSL